MADAQPVTVTDLLRHQHTEIRSLFAQVEQLPGEQRVQTFDCLRRLLAVHETAEELVVHPAARQLSDEAAAVVDQRLAEEQVAERMLASLDGAGADGGELGGELVELRRVVEAHAGAEEADLFPLLEERLPAEELRQMAERVEAAEAMAPTHPHPHAPASATGQLLSGPFLAMVDKVRDRLRSG
jgi:hemerythrin superfamily protein